MSQPNSLPARVAAIFDRELTRLDELSQAQGLDLDSLRCLDLLIKAHRTFSLPNTPPDASDPPDDVSSISTEKLLTELENGQTTERG